MIKRTLDIAIGALSALLLAFGLFGSGLVVCMMPQTTQMLGTNFSGWDDATYPQETMEQLAEAVRSFSVDDTGRELLEHVVNEALVNNFPAVAQSIETGNTGQNVGGNLTADGLGIGNLISIYTLPPSALDHLQDCVPLFATLRISIVLSLVFSIAGLILLILRRRRNLAGWIMFVTPLVVIAAIVILGMWAFIDFDSLFTKLHGLFFTNGTWLFPADSLLITLFPEGFWMGMGIVWVVVSIVASLIVSLVGRFVKRS